MAFARSAAIFGATAGGRSGAGPRAGVDLTLMLTQCRDSCSGIGPTFGIVNFKSKEYFAGIAAGAAYMASVWMDLTVRIKEGEVNQIAASWGMGMFAMVYIGGGLDLQNKSPFAEAGLTLKIPVEL